MRVAHASERIELQARIHVHVVEIHRGLQGHLVARQSLRVVDLVPAGVFHQQVHGGLEGLELGHLLEHPREHGLAGEIKRTNVTREFRMLAAHALCGPANRRFQLTVGVDELLQRPIQRAR